MYTLRPYMPADYERLIELFLLNSPEYFLPEEQGYLEKYLQSEREKYFVIAHQGQVVASGGYNVLGETGRLSWYMVHPQHQGRGLGRQLAEHSLELLRGHAAVAEIEVRTSQLVYPFYEKLGFVLLFTKDHFWGQGMHLYHMVLPEGRAG